MGAGGSACFVLLYGFLNTWPISACFVFLCVSLWLIKTRGLFRRARRACGPLFSLRFFVVSSTRGILRRALCFFILSALLRGFLARGAPHRHRRRDSARP